MNIESVREKLKTKRIGQNIIHYRSIDSTNAEAKRLFEDGDRNGVVLVADTQSGGRGRLSRTWSSPRGGLWFSVILNPEGLFAEKLPILSLLAGVSVAEALKQLFNVDVNLKWPNDIVVGNKKLGGILLESIYTGKKFSGIIMGIGLNTDLTVTDLPPLLKDAVVTLKDSLEDREISNELILAEILNIIEDDYQLLLNNKEDDILQRWKALSITIGSRVAVNLENNTRLVGEAVGVKSNGALVILTDDGSQHIIIAGDCIHLNEIE